MPLPREVEYWDDVAKINIDGNTFADNVWKRPEQLKRLLEYNWMGQKVLEVGTGNGVVAGALQLAVEGHWKYIGTELAQTFREWSLKCFHLNTIEADVRELPGTGYTRIIALDSLEHVRPEHREEGYKKIAEVCRKDALLFIHLSNEKSFHVKEFDHSFGLKDLSMIEEAGFQLRRYESYSCPNPEGPMDFAFVVMKKK